MINPIINDEAAFKHLKDNYNYAWVFWPAWRLPITIGKTERAELNPLQELVLRLADAGLRSTQEKHDALPELSPGGSSQTLFKTPSHSGATSKILTIDLLTLIETELYGKRLIDGDGEMTERGRRVLEDSETDRVVTEHQCYLYLDALSLEPLPLITMRSTTNEWDGQFSGKFIELPKPDSDRYEKGQFLEHGRKPTPQYFDLIKLRLALHYSQIEGAIPKEFGSHQQRGKPGWSIKLPDPSITSEKVFLLTALASAQSAISSANTTLLQDSFIHPLTGNFSPKFHDYFNRHSEDDAVKEVYIAQKKFLISRVSQVHENTHRDIWLPKDRELQRVTELLSSLQLSPDLNSRVLSYLESAYKVIYAVKHSPDKIKKDSKELVSRADLLMRSLLGGELAKRWSAENFNKLSNDVGASDQIIRDRLEKLGLNVKKRQSFSCTRKTNLNSKRFMYAFVKLTLGMSHQEPFHPINVWARVNDHLIEDIFRLKRCRDEIFHHSADRSFDSSDLKSLHRLIESTFKVFALSQSEDRIQSALISEKIWEALFSSQGARDEEAAAAASAVTRTEVADDDLEKLRKESRERAAKSQLERAELDRELISRYESDLIWEPALRSLLAECVTYDQEAKKKRESDTPFELLQTLTMLISAVSRATEYVLQRLLAKSMECRASVDHISSNEWSDMAIKLGFKFGGGVLPKCLSRAQSFRINRCLRERSDTLGAMVCALLYESDAHAHPDAVLSKVSAHDPSFLDSVALITEQRGDGSPELLTTDEHAKLVEALDAVILTYLHLN